MRLIDADEVKRRMFDGCCTMAHHFVDETPTVSPWHRVEDGYYAVRDGFVYKLEVKIQEGRAITIPPIKMEDYEPPKEDA